MAARWTLPEDRALRGLYQDGVSLHEIGHRLRRSEQSVSERRRALGIPARPRIRAWTATEDALLRAAVAVGVPATVFAQHIGRPAEQVRRRRRRIAGARWSPRAYSAAEDERVRACWELGGDVVALAIELRRSMGSVRLRAQTLGVHSPQRRTRWRPDEDAIVRDGYEHAQCCEQISRQLRGRTAGAIAARAAKLGIATYGRAWSQLDDERLRVLTREGLPTESIAQALGRTPQALLLRARKHRDD